MIDIQLPLSLEEELDRLEYQCQLLRASARRMTLSPAVPKYTARMEVRALRRKVSDLLASATQTLRFFELRASDPVK